MAANMQIIAVPEGEEGKKPIVLPGMDEPLEVKLKRIQELVPTRVNNTSGSSAGSGSGDFHQYRQMRRTEQDRLKRMDVDYKKRVAELEFVRRREERLKAAEEKTAKRRAKRQKKKEKKKQKTGAKEGGAGGQERGDSEDDDSSEEDAQHAEKVQELQGALD